MDGALTIREMGAPLPKHRRNALPFFSTDTVDEAHELQTLFCELSKDDKAYRWTRFAGTLDALDDAAADARRAYAHLKRRRQRNTDAQA